MTDKTFRILKQAKELIKAGKTIEADKLLRSLPRQAAELALVELVAALDQRGEGDRVRPCVRQFTSTLSQRPRRK